jgi:anti-sigma-K factor RskA
VNGSVGQVFAAVGSLAFWVPFGAAAAAVAVVALVAAVTFGINLARIVLSFLTLGGGSAA